MRDSRVRLYDMMEAIERIQKYAVRGRAEFENDELVQNWIVHHLQILGESVRGLPNAFRDRYSSVPWIKIIGIRNILVHQYFEIDKEIVWTVVERDLPDLKVEVTKIIEDLGTDDIDSG